MDVSACRIQGEETSSQESLIDGRESRVTMVSAICVATQDGMTRWKIASRSFEDTSHPMYLSLCVYVFEEPALAELTPCLAGVRRYR